MKLLLPVILFFLTSMLSGQEIKVFENFDAFEPVLHKSNDTIYVINFWATWCVPCIKELPYFQEVNENYRNNNVKVILVSLDMAEKVSTVLIPFLQKKNISTEVIVLDDPRQNSWIEKVDKNWQGSIPATLIYYKSKREFFEQSFTYDELIKELNRFIN